jgi:hypothetical protein
MRALTLVITLGGILASPIALAQQNTDEHAAHHPPEQTAAPAPQPEQGDSQGGKLQQDMKKMQDLMARILTTEDPKLRNELLQQHLQAMRDQIKMMRKVAAMKMDMKGMMGMMGMMGGDGKGDAVGADGKADKKDGMMEGKKGGMMGGGMMMMMMHKRMEQRFDMVEQLVEQMVEHEAAEAQGEGR